MKSLITVFDNKTIWKISNHNIKKKYTIQKKCRVKMKNRTKGWEGGNKRKIKRKVARKGKIIYVNLSIFDFSVKPIY